jgi:hypothetical protein
VLLKFFTDQKSKYHNNNRLERTLELAKNVNNLNPEESYIQVMTNKDRIQLIVIKKYTHGAVECAYSFVLLKRLGRPQTFFVNHL